MHATLENGHFPRHQSFDVKTFINKNFRHLLIFYVQAFLKTGPMKIFFGKKFRQLTQILSLFPMQLLPMRYTLFDVKHHSLCSSIFKYFTTFLKGTWTTLPSLSLSWVHKLNPTHVRFENFY